MLEHNFILSSPFLSELGLVEFISLFEFSFSLSSSTGFGKKKLFVSSSFWNGLGKGRPFKDSSSFNEFLSCTFGFIGLLKNKFGSSTE